MDAKECTLEPAEAGKPAALTGASLLDVVELASLIFTRSSLSENKLFHKK